MVLSTHAVIGAAVASAFPGHPLIGFVAGFASHFVADAIPHWHYQLTTTTKDEHTKHTLNADMVINKDFPLDLLKVGIDAMIGLLAVFFFIGPSLPMFIVAPVFFGAIGGMLPDALTFVYWKWRHEPLITLQRFHLWIHAETNYDAMPVFGPTAQFAIMAASIMVVRIFAF